MGNSGVNINLSQQGDLIIPISSQSDLPVGIGFTIPYMLYDYQILDIIAALTGVGIAEVDLDILVNTVSIFATTITIDIGENNNTTAATPYVLAAGAGIINKGDKVEFEIIANGTDAKGGLVTLMGNRLS